MKTQYFGEYTEKHNNTIPASELTGLVRVHNVKDKYLVYLKTKAGVIYDLPAFMTKYINRTVAVIARIYNKTVNVATKDNCVVQKTYNKLVVIRARPIDALEEELEDMSIE